MSRKRISPRFLPAVLALTTCLAVPAVAADTPATAPRPAATQPATRAIPPAAALIEQLRAEEYAVRAKARAELAAQGEAARAALEAAARADADPDQVSQVLALLGQLDAARRYGPTPVTLHVRGVPAPEALAAITAQANVTFAPPAETLWAAGAGGGTPPNVTLDVDKQPFWSAVQQLCAQSGVRVASCAPGGPVQLAAIGKLRNGPN